METDFSNRAKKSASTRRKNTADRNKRIKARANELYNSDRKRYDDVITILAETFGLSCETIRRILKK